MGSVGNAVLSPGREERRRHGGSDSGVVPQARGRHESRQPHHRRRTGREADADDPRTPQGQQREGHALHAGEHILETFTEYAGHEVFPVDGYVADPTGVTCARRNFPCTFLHSHRAGPGAVAGPQPKRPGIPGTAIRGVQGKSFAALTRFEWPPATVRPIGATRYAGRPTRCCAAKPGDAPGGPFTGTRAPAWARRTDQGPPQHRAGSSLHWQACRCHRPTAIASLSSASPRKLVMGTGRLTGRRNGDASRRCPGPVGCFTSYVRRGRVS